MPRFLHTSIFVNDMKESIDFYTGKLGIKLLDGPYHYPGNADMAFVGNDWNAYIEYRVRLRRASAISDR